MGHVLEPAASGRAKCRACQRPIAQGELRFGERLPNPYAEGEMTLWFHPACAGFQRPEAVLALPSDRPVLCIGVEGTVREVSWQMEALKSEIAPFGHSGSQTSQLIQASVMINATGTPARRAAEPR